MSFRGNLLRAGIDSDGIDVTFYRSSGVVTFAGTAVFEGTISFSGAIDFDTEVDVAFTDADGGANGLHSAILMTKVGAAATRAILGELTFTPATAGTACPIGVEGKVNLNGNLTEANNYNGYGWGVQGRIHVVTGTTIAFAGDYDPGAVYAALRGITTDAGTSTYTDGTITSLYAETQISQDASSGTFRVFLAWLRNQGSGTATNVDAALYIDAGNAWLGDSIAIGVDINDCTTGIDIGAATTGINLSGAMTDGIIIAGAMADNGVEISGVCSGAGVLISGASAYGLDITGDCSSMAIHALSQTQAVMQIFSAVTLAADTNVVEITCASVANANFEMRALYVSAYPSTEAQATAGSVAGYFTVLSALNVDYLKGVYSYFNCSAAKTIATASSAIWGDVNVDFATTVSAGALSAVKAQVRGDSALTGSLYGVEVDLDMDVTAGIDMDVAAGKTCTTGIEIGVTSTGAYTTGILIGGAATGIDIGACTTGIKIDGVIATSSIVVGGDAHIAFDATGDINVAIYSDYTDSDTDGFFRGLYVETRYMPTDLLGGASVYGIRGKVLTVATYDNVTGTEYICGVHGAAQGVADAYITGDDFMVSGVRGELLGAATNWDVKAASAVEAKNGLTVAPTATYYSLFHAYSPDNAADYPAVLSADGYFSVGLNFGTHVIGMDNLFSVDITNGPAVATVKANDADGGSISILVDGAQKWLHYWTAAA